MAVTLTETDLLAIISKEELDGRAKQLLESGQPDPVETMITEGLATIRLYVDPYKLRDDALKKFWRILAVAWLYNRLGRMPPKRREEQDWAIGVLEDIRDGKFKHLMLDQAVVDELAESGGGGEWGSNPKITSFTGFGGCS